LTIVYNTVVWVR